MKPALSANSPDFPSHWNELPQGDALRQLSELWMGQWSRQCFGHYLVKLGALSSQLQLPDCPIKHHINQTRKSARFSSLVAEPFELPFREASVDAFILAHELDFASDPHQVLREVDRCITDKGDLLICGFNPLSLAGLCRWLPLKRRRYMRQARFFSAWRVKDWLQLLGFEIVAEHTLVFSELVIERSFEPDTKIQQWAGKYLSSFGSVYMLQAKKRTVPMSPVKMGWRLQPKFTAVGASMYTSS